MVYVFRDIIITSKKKFIDFMRNMGYNIKRPRKYKSHAIEQAEVVGNNKLFTKTLRDHGLRVYSLIDFDFDEHRNKEILWK